MRERILKFLELENLTSAKFADDIGVQRSSVSHILSGRNNPSFEFIQKILSRYKFINAEWLVMGTGNMVKTVRQGDLFENTPPEVKIPAQGIGNDSNIEAKIDQNTTIISEPVGKLENEASPGELKKFVVSQKQIEKVVILYKDKSFASYIPDQE
jgi:transcriptional regulator with XRE-family HTH domain